MPAGYVTEYAIPSGNNANNICVGPDNNIWFTQATSATGKIGKLDLTTKTVTEYSIPTAASSMGGIWNSGDGRVCFSENSAARVCVVNTDGTGMTEYTISTAVGPAEGCVGSDGNWWVTCTGTILKMTTAGTVLNVFPATVGGHSICLASDNRVWYTALASDLLCAMTTAGVESTFALAPSHASSMQGVRVGPDGNLWVARSPGGNQVFKVNTSGAVVAYYALPTANAGPHGFASDGTGMWVGCINSNEWINVTTAGVAVAYTCPTPFTVAGAAGNGNPDKLCYGPDGNLYSAYHASAKIARVNVR